MAKKAKTKRPSKLNVHFCFFSYGGNGGFSSCHPEVGFWFADVVQWCKNDKRVGKITRLDVSDTPITMTRNLQVVTARKLGAHVIVMVDSDQHPDLYVGKDPLAKPMFQSAFNFIWDNYEKKEKGVMVGAPYCGPPPHPIKGGYENVYVFRWETLCSEEGAISAAPGGLDNYIANSNGVDYRLEAYSRIEAIQSSGIQECAALPTGGVVADMRVFEVTEPTNAENGDHGQWRGWFYYEYTNCYACEKASTEDVTMTRDLSLTCQEKFGYNPVYCNWDAWMGHYKPKCVGKPVNISVGAVAHRLRRAVLDNANEGDSLIYFSSEDGKQASIADRTSQARAQTTPEVDVLALESLIKKVCSTKKAGSVVRVAEVGTWIGDTAKRIVAKIKECGMVPEVHCVDHFMGSLTDQTRTYAGFIGGILSIFVENVGDLLNESIFVHKGDSESVASGGGVPKCDLVFIDADHSKDACLSDIRAWSPMVLNGGILAGHDYSIMFPGVAEACDEAFGPDFVSLFAQDLCVVWYVEKGKDGKWVKSATTNAVVKPAKSKKPRRSTRTKATATATTRSAGSAKGGTSARSSLTAKRKSTRKSVKPRK